MIIQHNISAMNARRNLDKNNNSLKKNLEKLSSGYRINRSADDAAGLAISEKMRASISILEQAGNNAQDGISLVQTADGAMQEIHDMLNRMTSLAAQASTGTNSDKERLHIQEEIDAILREITRIKNETTFNEIPILQGTDIPATNGPVTLGGLPAWVEPSVTDGKLSDTYDPGKGDGNHAAAVLDFTQGFNKDDLLADNEVGFNTTCCTCNNHYSIKFSGGTTHDVRQSGTHYVITVGIGTAKTPEDVVAAIVEACGGTATTAGAMGRPIVNHYTEVKADPNNPGKLILYDNRPLSSARPNGDRGIYQPGVSYDVNDIPKVDITLQIGENDTSTMFINLPDMSQTKIGVLGLNVKTAASAQKAIGTLKTGIDYVNSERARMGAYQNRLEHAYNNLTNTVENLTKSESQIRDVDMATEMMSYTKNNILAQSAQAMLAQANQVPQNVLQLMQ